MAAAQRSSRFEQPGTTTRISNRFKELGSFLTSCFFPRAQVSFARGWTAGVGTARMREVQYCLSPAHFFWIACAGTGSRISDGSVEGEDRVCVSVNFGIAAVKG